MIIAEIGSVHDGSFGNALKLIECASQCGADAVKFQTHIAEAETLTNAPSPSYFSQESRYDYFSRTSFSLNQWIKLKEEASKCNISFLSSPFSIEAIEILQKVGVFGYKIPSGEVTNIPLLEAVSLTRKPVFLSSGMSNWEELDQAVNILRKNCELTVFQCSSIYPCPPEKVGLNVLLEMKKRYGCAIGFSDHTLGFSASIAAAALGAKVIEKHFTFSKYMYGSDAKHSMEPKEFKNFCAEVKNAWKTLSNPVDKNEIESYLEMKNIFQKSIVSSIDIKKETLIERKHLAFKKPGDGIQPKDYKKLIGLYSKQDISKDQKITFSMFYQK